MGRPGELQGDRRRLQRDLPHRRLHNVDKAWTKSARDTSFWIVNDHNYMCFVPRHQHRDELAQDWDHHEFAICHYVVFPNTVFNCNPEHIQVFNPIPIDVDRTRFLCWEIDLPGRRQRPRVRRLPPADAGPLGAPEGRRRRGHRDLPAAGTHEALERLSRDILNARECKIAHYHETMAQMIQGDG